MDILDLQPSQRWLKTWGQDGGVREIVLPFLKVPLYGLGKREVTEVSSKVSVVPGYHYETFVRNILPKIAGGVGIKMEAGLLPDGTGAISSGLFCFRWFR